MNAAQVLLADHDDARVALVCGSEEMSRGELREAVARAGAKWRARGVRRGDRVAIKLPDGFDWVVAYLGVIWAGGVAVGVNPRVPAKEWLAILDAAGFLFILAEAGDDTPEPWSRQVISLPEWRRELPHAAPCEAQPMGPEDPVLWVHSSGTSGHPKAVVHPQRIALEIERVGRERLGLTAEDRIYASSKLFFAYPLANCILAGLKLGATVILDPQWPTAQGVVASIMARRANVLFSVPSLYRNLLKEGLAGQLAQCGVRLYVSAGEALPATLRDEWKRQLGRTIVNGFGASETLVLVLVDSDDGHGLRVSPGVDVAALDARGPARNPDRRRPKDRSASSFAVRPLHSATGTAPTCRPSTSAMARSRRPTCSSAWKAAAGASPGATIRWSRCTAAGSIWSTSSSALRLRVPASPRRPQSRFPMPTASMRSRCSSSRSRARRCSMRQRCASMPIAFRPISDRAGCIRSRRCHARRPASWCAGGCAICTQHSLPKRRPKTQPRAILVNDAHGRCHTR